MTTPISILLAVLVMAACGGDGTDSGPTDLASAPTADSAGKTDDPAVTIDAGSTKPYVPLFPASSAFYEDVSGAAVDSQWDTIRSAVDTKGGWGHGKIEINFQFNVLTADASLAPIDFTPITNDFFVGECDTAPIPLPAGGAVEGQSNYACDVGNDDCHLVVIQGTRLYEAWKVNVDGGLSSGVPFQSGCLAVWDLTKDYWQPVSSGEVFSRGDHCGSADAGGFPMAALLFSADELASGELHHAIRFIMPNDRIRSDKYVHPATHAAGSGASDVLPYGARLRLKAGKDISALKPWAQVVARAMKKYGMFLSDGGNQALTAQSDQFTTAKWGNNLGQNDLGSLSFDDFEMVEGGTRVARSGNCPHVVITQ